MRRLPLTVRAATVSAGGHRFALVEVTATLLEEARSADVTAQLCGALFPELPIVLVAAGRTGSRCLYGRGDLTAAVVRLDLDTVPWQEYPL